MAENTVALNIVIGMVNKATPALQKLENNVGDLTGGLINLRTQAVSAGGALYNIGSVAGRGLSMVGSGVSAALASVAKLTAMVGAAGVGVAGTLAAAVKSATDLGSTLWDMHTKTGAEVEALSALKYASEQTGASLEAVGTGLKFVARNAYESTSSTKDTTKELDSLTEAYQNYQIKMKKGLDAQKEFRELVTAGKAYEKVSDDSGDAAKAFSALGISVTDASGQFKSSERLFIEAGEAIRNVRTDTERTALAMKIFGRSGSDLLPLFLDTKGSVTELMAEASRLGVIMSSEGAEAADDFGDSMDRLRAKLGMGFVELGLKAMPALQLLVDTIIGRVMPAMKRFGGGIDIAPLIGGFAEGVMRLLAAVMTLGAWFSANQTLVGQWFQYLVAWGKYAVDWVSSNLPQIAATVVNIVADIADAFTIAGRVWNGFKTGLLVVGKVIAEVFMTVGTIIGGILTGIMASVYAVVSAVNTITFGSLRREANALKSAMDWMGGLTGRMGQAQADLFASMGRDLTSGRAGNAELLDASARIGGMRQRANQWAANMPAGARPTAPTTPTGQFTSWASATVNINVDARGAADEAAVLRGADAVKQDFKNILNAEMRKMLQKNRLAPA